jgi:predicted Zn-dependent protease
VSLSRGQSKKILDKALGEASVGDLRVKLEARTSGNARFGDSKPTTGGDIEELTLSVTATTPDGRHATVQGNRTDDDAIAELVQAAEAIAKLSPVDPEHPQPLGKQKYARINAIDRAVTKMTSDTRGDVVEASIGAGKLAGTVVSGFLEHRDAATAFADRAGLFGYHRGTSVSLGVTCRTPDGTGSSKGGFASYSASTLDAKTLAGDTARWALRSRAPTALDPGQYTVILTPNAVSELLGFFVHELSHRRASEGRSYFSAPDGGTKIGETLFKPSISMWSDPADKDFPAAPFARDGRPQNHVDWITDGKLLALSASRAWVEKSGAPSIPRPNTLHMKGGTGDLDALIAGVDKGVLVTRFWYNRMLDPRTILATGLTRDGTFLVEGGTISRPVKNFRYNDSPVTLLKKAVAMGKPERAGLSTHRIYVVPPMVVEGFNFASVSDAI